MRSSARSGAGRQRLTRRLGDLDQAPVAQRALGRQARPRRARRTARARARTSGRAAPGRSGRARTEPAMPVSSSMAAHRSRSSCSNCDRPSRWRQKQQAPAADPSVRGGLSAAAACGDVVIAWQTARREKAGFLRERPRGAEKALPDRSRFFFAARRRASAQVQPARPCCAASCSIVARSQARAAARYRAVAFSQSSPFVM